MGSARRSTQGKLDRQLERLEERAGELLEQLTDTERMALTCWRDSIMPDTYEIDHDAITARPYESIRRVERWDDEYDIEEQRAAERAAQEAVKDGTGDMSKLKSFIAKLNEQM